MNWIVLLSSAVVAALVSGFAALLTSERRISAENVIQERMKWREKVRDLAADVYELVVSGEPDTKKYQQLRAQLTLRLNPHDEEDHQILTLVAAGDNARAEEFTQRIALLLKHDWERAKRDANLLQWLCEREPDRVQFHNYRPGQRRIYAKLAI